MSHQRLAFRRITTNVARTSIIVTCKRVADTSTEDEVTNMAEGTIKRITDKGYGFIDSGTNDVFFHSSSVADQRFEELREGQRVTYEMGQGPKGPRAENVRAI